MARNKLEDLRDQLFGQLERLNNEDLTKEQLELETKRAKSMTSVSSTIVDTAKLEIQYLELNDSNESQTQLFKEIKGEPLQNQKRLGYES